MLEMSCEVVTDVFVSLQLLLLDSMCTVLEKVQSALGWPVGRDDGSSICGATYHVSVSATMQTASLIGPWLLCCLRKQDDIDDYCKNKC